VTGEIQLQAKECQGLPETPEAKSDKETFPIRVERESMALSTSFQASASTTVRAYISVVLQFLAICYISTRKLRQVPAQPPFPSP
jgi:hypothetical protein